ncbi:centrosomal protein of 131 kDa-like isoform X2 [Melanaphis sacchari]|uniref:centrosomal protein of 131 kDa-like isoform X2 n=1 Tax=Melanaphis sacchari TaxID=742174 RepID=UPI000DC12D21|nr:centrosomal protein of 131 kDa-like isoform X2 [Melanaphis sacchari]
MSNFKKKSKANKHIVTSTGLSLQGSQINLSTRLSNLNISNPLHYLYNENVDTPSRGRPMSALTLSATNQESPRRTRLVRRPQSADTINKITKSRHISFDFNDQKIDTDIGNHEDRQENAFDESDGAELSSSSDGHSTPVPPNDGSGGGGSGGGDGDGQPALEPGLTSKPPIPPGGSDAHVSETFGRAANGSTATFDDAVELKFQRWFPNSAPVLVPAPMPTTDVCVGSVASDSVTDGRTVAYAKSGRGQLDEEHLYSNLSAAIGSAGDRFGGSVSVDLSGALRGANMDGSDRGRTRSTTKLKNKVKKKIVPVATPAVGHRAKHTRDAIKSKSVASVAVQPVEAVVPRNEQLPERQPETKRDRSKNADRSPVQDYAREDVVSWMSSHLQRPCTPSDFDGDTLDAFTKEKHKTSTYDEIVNILKELESENNDIDMNVRKSGVTDNNKHQTLVPESSSSSKALWSFLDEVEKNSNCPSFSKSPKHKSPVNLPNTPPSSPGKRIVDVKKGNLQQVMDLDKAELAQKVAMLKIQLSEKEDITEKLKTNISELQAEHAKTKSEYESTVMRHQKFIDKLLNEKKQLSESCSLTVKELTKKMNDALTSQEERHRVELKKAIDKQTASEKIKKDRWVDLKTKKIKEMTIKGIEPELNRMSVAYQEELSELRRIHQSQIEEIEATWHRRMATMRDKMDAEREQAIVTERENSRNRLEMEIAELEKSYQDQRKRLLGEIHAERLRQERENEVTLMEKQKILEQKFEKLVLEMQEKINKKEQEFQNELKTIRETCETEKTKWIQHQTSILIDKESNIKEMCKKERDKHIELVVQKLENEASEREKRRIKSEYEADIRELENTISGHRMKLNEARTKAQEYEDKIANLTSELNKCNVEQIRLQELVSKLKNDLDEKENIIKDEAVTKIGILKTELIQSKLNFETKMKTIENEKEKEINHVYVRVKEAIKRKDETINILKSERNAALDQCSNMERLLDRQRKELLKLK